MKLRATINGREYVDEVEPRTLLSDFIRHQARLTGTHVGCEHGVCGACTVLLDGEPIRSCLMLAIQADGRSVTTVEGLSRAGGELGALARAFTEHHAVQCGFCSPGMIITALALLQENPDPTEAEIRTGISGNLCRCTGYQNIVISALDAAKRLRAEAGEEAKA